MSGRRAFNLACYAFETLPEKVLQIPSNTIDRQQAEIVDMNVAVFMSISNLRGINAVEPVFSGDIR
jgi:hypothetical protein